MHQTLDGAGTVSSAYVLSVSSSGVDSGLDDVATGQDVLLTTLRARRLGIEAVVEIHGYLELERALALGPPADWKPEVAEAARSSVADQLAEDLGVDYVVEGTVRWARGSGGQDRVRITPKLIRVTDDTQLWSESFDRRIDDIDEAIDAAVAAASNREAVSIGVCGGRRFTSQTTAAPTAVRSADRTALRLLRPSKGVEAASRASSK